ncbi:hypothetical protein BVX93_02215 [bacterium B13(2017)]|nr:hypothetical protein BVX93_02215 [bacterium B13(2017)]
MKKSDVPQDESILGNLKRAFYAVNENGEYDIVASKGWEVEKIVNDFVHEGMDEELEKVKGEVLKGEASSLKFHMFKHQMTISLLSEYTGIWKWKIKRHLKPSIFNSLSEKEIQQYADAFNISINELREIPEKI